MAVMPPPSANKPMGSGLTFTKMSDLGIGQGMDLTYRATDASAKVFLCVGEADNRVPVTGTTPSSRQAAVLAAIDQFGAWGQNIQLWMVAEKNGEVTARTAAVAYRSHVKPYRGKLKIGEIAADQPPMTYPGNGKGRLLSKPINDRYYFVYGGKLETNNDMRGFDCTSFPMVLFSIKQLTPPGYGKQVCDGCGAVKCEMEQLKGADLAKRFKEDTIPNGLYILFSEGHVLLYNSDLNTLYEFNYGGFRATPAAQRTLQAPRDLWWMRKLSESYRPLFG
jgi:hypothetical protein